MENFRAPHLADLHQRILYEKFFLSPIRRVPFDILQLIFLACLPRWFVEARHNQAPLILCQNCRYWRNVELAMRTSCRVIRHPNGLCKPALPLAELWLSRSHPPPISIYLPVDENRRCSPPSDDVQQLLRLFFRHLSGWKTIHMCLRDLIYYEREIPPSAISPLLEKIEICFPLNSFDSVYDLGSKKLTNLTVPSLWVSSPLLHTLTINATGSSNVLEILGTCLNIRDCEFHIRDIPSLPHAHAKLHLPSLHTLNIRARTTAFHVLQAITVPALRRLTIKGEKRWSQASLEDLLHLRLAPSRNFRWSKSLLDPTIYCGPGAYEYGSENVVHSHVLRSETHFKRDRARHLVLSPPTKFGGP